MAENKKMINLIIKIALVILVIVSIIGGAIFGVRNYIKSIYQQGYDTALTELQEEEQTPVETKEITVEKKELFSAIAPAADLVTTKYYYSNIAHSSHQNTFAIFDWQINIPFTKDEILYAYNGVIQVGLDINTIDFEIDEDNKTVIVKLPELKILSHMIDDEMDVYTLNNSPVTETSLQQFNDMRKEILKNEELRLKAREEYWSSIRKNSEMVIGGFIKPLIKDYTIEFVWNNEMPN